MTDRKYPPEVLRLLERYKGQRATPYLYYDADRQLLGCVMRIDKPGGKDIKQYRYFPESGKWVAKAVPPPRPLYNLHALMDTPPDKPVLIVEGEKTAEAAMLIPELSEFVVVTWSGGANAVGSTDWSPLDGRKKVVIWPDNDEPGMKAAREIAKILHERNEQ